MAEGAEEVGQQAGGAQSDQHERDREIAGVSGRAGGRRERGPEHAEDDRGNRKVLFATGVLAEHALCEEHEEHEACGQRRLDDDERCEQQREQLQGPAEDREPGPEQPARTSHEAAQQRDAQMRGLRGLLGIGGLQGDP